MNTTIANSRFNGATLGLNYNSTNSQYVISGNANFSATGIGVANVTLGCGTGSTGIVIVSGALSSFDMTLSSNLTVAGVTLGVNGLRMTQDVANRRFTMTGNATFRQSNIGTVNVILGCSTATPATTGLVITDGSLTNLDMTVDSNISIAGMTLATKGLRITESIADNCFTMTGSSSLSANGAGSISVVFGGGTTSGMVITNGSLTRLDANLTSNISVGGVSFNIRNLTFSYSSENNYLSITGSTKFIATGFKAIDVYFGGTGSSGRVGDG